MEKQKARTPYIVWLLIGLIAQALPGIVPMVWGSGLFTIVWIYAFMRLTADWHSKKETLITGIVFVAGYMMKFGGAMGNPLLDIGLFGVFGAALYAVFALSAYFTRRVDKLPGTLIFPALWIAEYLIATWIRFPSLLRVDMMFADMTVMMQSERFIGSAGMSFAILWMISLLRYAAARRQIRWAILSLALMLALVVPGLINMYPNTFAREQVRVAYTTGIYSGDFMNYKAPDYAAQEASVENAARKASEAKAEILVFNEEAFEMDDRDEDRFIDRCASLAHEHSLVMLVGLDIRDTDGSAGGLSTNKLVLIDADGTVLSSYRKSRLIPIIESGYESGDGEIPYSRLRINGKDIGVSYLICYDSNFPEYVKRIDPETDILFLPSWDWPAITDLHAKLCRAIAIENGVYIVKPTYDGISVAIDPDGQILYTSSTAETGYETMHIADMPIRSSIAVKERGFMSPPIINAIIGAEIFAGCVCLVLLLGNSIGRNQRTKRTMWFNTLVLANMSGSFADALSWILDGCERLHTVLYISTTLSVVLTLSLIVMFAAYLTEYIRERKTISRVPITISMIYVIAAIALTLIATMAGQLFTFENGFFREGPLYPMYVIVNSLSMVIGLGIVTAYRKVLTRVDRMVAYAYMVVPMAAGIMGLFVEDFSFAYPVIALSLILVYVTLQSDHVEMLEHQGSIVSYHATHDELTGLRNRRAFSDRMDALKTEEGTVGIIFGDINGLKFANDNYGHEAGDRLLVRYAEIISGIFRKNETYRISGDEFICMLENVPREVLEERARALADILNREELPLACIGSAYGDARDVEQLIRDSESQMYAQKQNIYKRFLRIHR